MMKNKYCGCCGNINKTKNDNWCAKCQPHVSDKYQAPWNNTYYALYNVNCPYSISDYTQPDVCTNHSTFCDCL